MLRKTNSRNTRVILKNATKKVENCKDYKYLDKIKLTSYEVIQIQKQLNKVLF